MPKEAFYLKITVNKTFDIIKKIKMKHFLSSLPGFWLWFRVIPISKFPLIPGSVLIEGAAKWLCFYWSILQIWRSSWQWHTGISMEADVLTLLLLSFLPSQPLLPHVLSFFRTHTLRPSFEYPLSFFFLWSLSFPQSSPQFCPSECQLAQNILD